MASALTALMIGLFLCALLYTAHNLSKRRRATRADYNEFLLHRGDDVKLGNMELFDE